MGEAILRVAYDWMGKKGLNVSLRGDRLPDEGPVSQRPGGKWQSLWWWLALGAAAVVTGMLAQGIKLPGGWLIGPLLVGIVAGLGRSEHPRLSSRSLIPAQAVIGTLLASTFRPEVLPLVAAHWLPVLLVVAATLGVSLVAGVVLGHISPLGRETATFGTLPGGSSGMIAMSVDSKADTRMVALMQYIRVVLVVLSAALLARFVLHPIAPAHPSALGMPAGQASPHLWPDYLLTTILAAVGAWAGYRTRLPAGGLIGPLVLGIVASGVNLLHPVWPPGVTQAAYILVGLYIGLLFDRASLRQAGRLIPVMVANTLVLMAVCAATGKVLAVLTGTDYLTGYLATTPGGMDSIAVVALGSGADVSFLVAVQMVRLLATVLAGPALARWLLGQPSGSKGNHFR
jgi:membrane AbrB-like protein